MKNHFLKNFALFALVAVSAAGCADSPTSMNGTSDLTGSETDGLFAANPMFRAIGPRFSVSQSTHNSTGLLAVAAEADGDGSVHAARRTTTLYGDEIKTLKIIPAYGGTIALPGAGMRVVIPAGALPGTDAVEVTVHAYAGKYHVYEFLPHGIQFNKHVRVDFRLANVEAFGETLRLRLTRLNSYAEQLAKCELQKALGGQTPDFCVKLFFMWADYHEDADWYRAALSSDGFVGVYFKGDVHGGYDLPALEIFDVFLTGDNLTFYTNHFSGYALGM